MKEHRLTNTNVKHGEVVDTASYFASSAETEKLLPPRRNTQENSPKSCASLTRSHVPTSGQQAMNMASAGWKTLCILAVIIVCFTYGNCIRIKQRHSKHRLNGTSLRSTRLLHRTTSPNPTGDTSSINKEEDNDLKNSIYSPWTEWSPCSRRCKQERSRQCNAPWRCGNVVAKEERSCTGPRCKRKPFTVVDSDQEPSHRDLSYGAMKTMLYAAWSEWSPCTRSCQTRRYRTCRMEVFCGDSAIQEDAYCYVKGTVCERMFRKSKKNHELPAVSKEQQPPKESTVRPSIIQGECGITNVSNDMALRIIGGQPVNRGRWPWQAAIINRMNEAFCGGTLVAPQWVMTAAHCVRKRLHVRMGEHMLSKQEGSEQDFRVVMSIVHPGYDKGTVDNDIALLKLSSPAVLDKGVQLACLPKQGWPLPLEKPCTILGWGKERMMAPAGTEVLREAKVPIVDIKNCLDVYEEYYITGNMFCAGYKNRRIDSCAGDSGGPLLCETNNRWHVYGITSFGEGCGRKGKYGIYAKVPNFITWMETMMEENSDVL